MAALSLELTTQRIVSAPPPAVWAVLVDARGWPDWCGPVRAVHQAPEVIEPGAHLAYTLSMGPGVPVRFDVTLTEVVEGQRLVWASSKWWGVRAERGFTLAPVEGGTRIRDTKRFQSPWWPVGWIYPRAAIRRMSEAWLGDLDAEIARRARTASGG